MDKNYLLLGQLYENIKSYRTGHCIDAIRIFLETSGYDVNYQIPHDSSFGKRQPEYIGYTALHFAVSEKKQDLVELLLSFGADVTCKDGNGYTPIRLVIENINFNHLTARYHVKPMLDILLSAHLKSKNVKNPSCNDGILHFHLACVADNLPIARFFLQAGVSINESVNSTSNFFPSWTPLHFAVRFGTEELVKLLLTNGANLNLVDSCGLTPLRFLAEQNIKINDRIRTWTYDTAIESMLLRIDTLINLFTNNSRENVIDDIGFSFFHVSCTKKDTNLVEKFLELGVDLNLKVNADSPMWPAYTPLHFAAHCNPEIFKLLVEKGADILAKDTKGETPLDLFVQRYRPAKLCGVLNVHSTFRHITFNNGVKLVDSISAMEHENVFARFVRDVNVNTRLPYNSPLWPGYTLTHLVVLSNTYNKRFITKCLHSNVDLMIQDFKGMMTPLHLAFRLKKRDIVKIILEEMMRSHSMNRVDAEGLSHLQIACIADNVTLVRQFLGHGFDSNTPTQKDLSWGDKTYRAGSPLYHIAAAKNSESIIKEFSRTGAKIDSLDADGLTALQVCFLENDHARTITTLLSLPENRKTNYTALRAGGLSHLHIVSYCICYNSNTSLHFDFVKELASVATDINVQINCGTAIDLYAKKLAPYAGWTPLHFAVKAECTEAIDALISKGADIHVKNAAGLNTLHLALLTYRKEDWGFNDVPNRLYSELKMKEEWSDDYGLLKLHVACFLADKNEIESLLMAGEDTNKQIDVNSPIWPGDSALHILIKSPHFEKDNHVVITLLLQLLNHGADLTLKNADDRTPLHILWDKFDLKYVRAFIIDLIMAAGPRFYKVNPSNRDGLSHFHISCMVESVDIVKNFIDSGVDVNQHLCPFTSKYAGFTPLHVMVHHKNEEVVELLLKHGADVKSENSKGLTAIQEAMLNSPSLLPVIFSNAQINLQDEIFIFQERTLGLLLEKRYKRSNFQVLLDIGFNINFIDPPARKENIARIALDMNNDLFQAFVEKATDVANIDVNGKNVVHSLGSIEIVFDEDEAVARCALNVNLWLDKGCDLNLQDKLGRTPLHDVVAMNGEVIKVLLLLGADVNIRDNQGRTAFSYLKDYYDDTRRTLLHHMLMMSSCGLYLEDSLNEIVRNEFSDDSEGRRRSNSVLARMANIRITDDMSLRDLLRERTIENFPHFNVEKRNIILEFLKTERLFEQYNEWRGWINMFQFQYRKILRRTKLLEPAKMAFYERIYQIPLECIEFIFLDLSNYDLENLIKV